MRRLLTCCIDARVEATSSCKACTRCNVWTSSKLEVPIDAVGSKEGNICKCSSSSSPNNGSSATGCNVSPSSNDKYRASKKDSDLGCANDAWKDCTSTLDTDSGRVGGNTRGIISAASFATCLMF